MERCVALSARFEVGFFRQTETTRSWCSSRGDVEHLEPLGGSVGENENRLDLGHFAWMLGL